MRNQYVVAVGVVSNEYSTNICKSYHICKGEGKEVCEYIFMRVGWPLRRLSPLVVDCFCRHVPGLSESPGCTGWRNVGG